MDCELDHLYQSRDEVKNVWSYTFISPYIFMSLYIVKHMNTFSLELLIWLVFGRNFTLSDRQTQTQTDRDRQTDRRTQTDRQTAGTAK
jgi:hypothetical protein